MKMKNILKDIKGVFILPTKAYYFGKTVHGCPYFYPWWFNSTILTIRKQRPQFLRCNYFKLFGYEISYGWPIKFAKWGLGWKDKFDTPRFEWGAGWSLYFFNWQFCMFYRAPDDDCDRYWEQVLWYLKYCDKDINKARDTWGWVDMEHKSTWRDKYLIQK
jgi:hypothetical protein